MKNRILYAFVLLLFVFGCTTSEPEASLEELQTTAMTNTNQFAKLMEDPAFMDKIKSHASSELSAKNGGNGVVFIERVAENFFAFVTSDFSKIIFIYADGFENLVNIKIFSEDKAQFYANHRDAFVEIYDLATEDLLYSNLCMDRKIGNLHINLIAPYFVNEDGSYTPDFSNAESANNLQMHAVVNDAAGFDEGHGFVCNDPTTVKSIKITSLIKLQGGRNFKITGL